MPTDYILELCDTSGEHQPIARFVSATPFMAVNVGDRFDDPGWARLDGVGVIASPEKPVRYTVHSIKHLVEERPDRLVIRYCLNLQPWEGAKSPVWGEE
ncbi:MAG: hypothetical protein QM796_12305 [Chthoniobacteraceae bacterium]